MGIFTCMKDDTSFNLYSYHTLGRNKINHTSIEFSDVSKLHAVISWENEEWVLKDQSKNGTLVDTKLIQHSSIKLNVGTVIQFGQSEGAKWKIVNLDPPASFFIRKGQILDNFNLPKWYETFPEGLFSFFYSAENKWFIDREDENEELVDGETYLLNDEEWIFVQNESLEETIDVRAEIKDVYFKFLLSQDLEDVHLKIILNDLIMDFKVRIHHHLLLILAREKQQDLEEKIDHSLAGWLTVDYVVNQLKKELVNPEIDQYFLNVQIHRIRTQLVKHTPYGYLLSDLIERKKGKLRFAYSNFSIEIPGVLDNTL